MGTAATSTRENRTITIDFQDETTYSQLLGDGKALVELVIRCFCEVWLICTTWYPASAVLSMPGSVVWKWKAEQSQHTTGSSTSRFSPPEAFDEW